MSTELEKQKIEDRKKEELLAEIIQGKDFTAIITLDKYEFHVHLLSIDEQLKVIIDSKKIRKDYGDENDPALIVLSDTIATLNRTIDKMYKVEKNDQGTEEKKEIEQKFWDYFKNFRDPKVYSKIITPLNEKYTALVEKMSLSGDELKKS
jgi:hypothetical protein